MSTEIATPEPRSPVIRPQVGLMLSIGEPPEGARNYPKKLDHFRPKPGSEDQYAEAVEKFLAAYPNKPKTLDIVLISNEIGEVLDIRWKAWGTSGLKAIGRTNYAVEPDRMFAADDVLTTFPETSPDPGEYHMKGPDDPTIEKTGLKLYAVFTFAIPKVTGLTTLAVISTTSKRSMLNLLAGLQQVNSLTGGHIAGIPFELSVRPARTRYFDEKKKKRATSTFYELVLGAPYSIDEFAEQVQLRRSQLGSDAPLELPRPPHDDPELDRELAPSLWHRPAREREIEDQMSGLPAPDEEDVQLRDEPEAAGRPSDAQLNRIADLERQLGGTPATFLMGAFAVESAEQLTEAQATQYERGLARLVEAQDDETESVEGEIVDESGEFPSEEQTAFKIPDSARKDADE